MKIEDEKRMRDINEVLWAFNNLRTVIGKLSRPISDLDFAIGVYRDADDRNTIPSRFALEWLEDAYEEIVNEKEWLQKAVGDLTWAFGSLGFALTIFADDLDEDDLMWEFFRGGGGS